MQPKFPANDPDCNVYVANLPCDYDATRLYILFSPYGKIIRHKFVPGELKTQPGYGFVQFAARHQAQNAIRQLNNYTFPTGETLYISLALHRRSTLSEEPTNLYVTNVPHSWKNDTLHKTFSKYGTIRQCKIIKDGVAFVRYDDHNQALDAIEKLNGTQIGLHVEFATRKSAATSYQLKKVPAPTKTNSHNLYVRNLPSNFKQKQLEKLFNQFGKICAAKLNNKGIAFVRYIKAEDALRAIEKLHRTKPDGFEQEIVVKLAHFDIGDCRNRMKENEMKIDNVSVASVSASVKSSPGINSVNSIPTVQSVTNSIDPMQSVNMVNMVNMVNPFMLVNNNLNCVPSVPLQPLHMPQDLKSFATLGHFGMPYPYISKPPMGYIIPPNMFSIPQNINNIPNIQNMNGLSSIANIPSIPNIPQGNLSNNVANVTQEN